MRDNEFVPGHLTGYNFLALSGLRLAIQMASETGHSDLAKNWQTEYDDYRAAFFKVLDAQAAAHNGYIPPALDGQKGGYDWGNLLAVVPEPILDPHDPRVTATLKATQAKYAEGIMTYANGEFLHHYLTIKNTHDRGDPRRSGAGDARVLRAAARTPAPRTPASSSPSCPGATATLRTTSPPTAGSPPSTAPCCAPCWSREEGNQLHLLSVVSPQWIGKGKTIAVSQAPTNFGPIAFTLSSRLTAKPCCISTPAS